MKVSSVLTTLKKLRDPSARLTSKQAAFTLGVSALLFGSSGTAAHLGMDAESPLAISSTRLALGGLLLMAWVLVSQRSALSLRTALRDRRSWYLALSLSFFQPAYFLSIQQAGVALGTMVAIGGVTVFTAIAGAFMGHKVTRVWVVSTTLCLTGLGLISFKDASTGDYKGIVFGIVAGIAGAGFTLSTKSILDDHIAPIPPTSIGLTVSGFVVGIVTRPSYDFLFTTHGILAAIYLGIVVTSFGNILWARGLGNLAPGPTTTLMLAEPAFATLLGVVVLKEALTGQATLGIILLFTGLALQGIKGK